MLTRPPGPPQSIYATELRCPQDVRQRLGLTYESGVFLKQRIGFWYALILTRQEPSWRLPQRQTSRLPPGELHSRSTPRRSSVAQVFPLLHRQQYVCNAFLKLTLRLPSRVSLA